MLPDAAINSRNIRAILFMVVAIFFMSTMDAVAKLLVQADYSVVQILAIRGAVLMPALCVWLFTHGGLGSVKTRQYKGHALRIILGVLAPLLFFLSLRKLPLADATVIFFISPFVMTALSVPLFKEKVGVHRWGAIIVGFMGVLFVMQPTSGLLEIEAFMVLGGSLCYCGIMLTGTNATSGYWFRGLDGDLVSRGEYLPDQVFRDGGSWRDCPFRIYGSAMGRAAWLFHIRRFSSR